LEGSSSIQDFSTVVTNSGTGVFCRQTYALKGILANGNPNSNRGSMCGTDATSSTDPPLFDSSRRYHLIASSPCVDKAGTTNIPPDAVDGAARPYGIAADGGADENVP
jgi:hypothetical protein